MLARSRTLTVTVRVSPTKTLDGVTVTLELVGETWRTVRVAVLVSGMKLTKAVRMEVPAALLVIVNEASPEPFVVALLGVMLSLPGRLLDRITGAFTIGCPALSNAVTSTLVD